MHVRVQPLLHAARGVHLISAAQPHNPTTQPRHHHIPTQMQPYREFVVNIISEWFIEAANHTCGMFDYGVNEMQLTGLTPVPSTKVCVWNVVGYCCVVSMCVSLSCVYRCRVCIAVVCVLLSCICKDATYSCANQLHCTVHIRVHSSVNNMTGSPPPGQGICSAHGVQACTYL